MPSGRHKGTKNKASHSAGGARASSGRKKKDNASSPISQAITAVQPGKLFFYINYCNMLINSKIQGSSSAGNANPTFNSAPIFL